VLVAGGLGERLGYSGIKVALPVESASGTCFLQLYVESILALQVWNPGDSGIPGAAGRHGILGTLGFWALQAGMESVGPLGFWALQAGMESLGTLGLWALQAGMESLGTLGAAVRHGILGTSWRYKRDYRKLGRQGSERRSHLAWWPVLAAWFATSTTRIGLLLHGFDARAGRCGCRQVQGLGGQAQRGVWLHAGVAAGADS
jgi:hypothetical protein